MANRPFAVFDIDGTLIRWQLYHAIVDRLAEAGHIPAHAYQKARDARMVWKHRRGGEGSFRAYELRLIDAYNQALTDLRIADLQQAVTEVFAEHKDQVYMYTRQLVAGLKNQDYLLFAISASQAEIVRLIADYYGFDDFAASTYEQKNGRFTGKSDLIIEKKQLLLRQLITKHQATIKGSVGIGDTESDIPLLELVEQPIAFNPNKNLFQHARAASWKIVIERKNVIYELEPRDGAYRLAATNAA